MRANSVPFPVYGVPLMGLAGLLACLWQPQMKLPAAGMETVALIKPSPRLDTCMAIFLRQEARNVAYSRRHDTPAVQAKMVENYNIVAQECTPAVFEKTHLPCSQ